MRRFIPAVLLLALGCHEDPDTIVVSAPATSPFAAPILAGTTLDFSQSIGSGDLGPDGQPRLVYVRSFSGGTSQLCYVRRTSSGTWTAPLALTAATSASKTNIRAFVSPNSMTHVLWLESATGVHYARVNDAAASIDVADGVISATVPGNVTAGAALSAAFAPDAVMNRTSGDLFVAWTQGIDDDGAGGGGVDVVPVVAVLLGGSGSFGEYVALVDPNTDGNDASSGAARLALSGSGVAHAVWVGGAAADDPISVLPRVRHSSRTGASAWSGGADGAVVSDLGSATVSTADLHLAADGDAYVVWIDSSISEMRADYRPAGGSFGADSTVATVTAATNMQSALEPGTEILHVFWALTVGAVRSVNARHHTAANLAGTWSTTDTLHSETAGANLPYAAWTDAFNNAVVVIQGPTSPNAQDHLLARVRPTGAASTYGTLADLTAAAALPVAGFIVSRNAQGDAAIAWAQGQTGATAPPAEAYGLVYSVGTFGSAGNASQSPSLATHVPGLALLSSARTTHLFFEETLTATDEHAVYYSIRP